MRKRSAAAPAAPDPTLVDLTQEQIEEIERQELEKKDFWQMHNALSISEREVSKVYVYRLVWPDNAAKPEGEDNNIDIIASHLFDRELLITKHGGGKYQLWHKSKLNGPKFNFKRVINIPGVAMKIPRRYIIVEDDGSEYLPADKSAPAAAPSPDVTGVYQQANMAAHAANQAASEALKSGLTLITTAAQESIKIVSQSKQKEGSEESAGITELRAELKSLRDDIKDQRIGKLEEELRQLREERTKPASAAGSEVAAAAETAKLFGIEGGFPALVKQLSGAEGKEEGILDYVGKGLGEGLKVFLSEQGGSLIQAWREYNHVRHLEVLKRNQPDAAPPPAPKPVASRPGLAGSQEPQPAQPAQETEEQMLARLINEITGTIAYYCEQNFNGAGVAEIVKREFRDYMGFLPQLDIFKDFGKLMEFCRANENLRGFADIPEFKEFATEFFEAFQPKQDPPPAVRTQSQ